MPLVDEVKYALPYQSVYYIIAIFGVIFLIFSLLWWKNILKVAHRNTAEWFLSAGRNMKGGIVTASIVSTWTWAATIMVSSKMGYDYGISGPYWYAAGATIPILLFSVVAVYVKKLAPQLHTFPEFILYRYDKKTHWIMIIIGLLACTIVTTMVILGGALALNVLTGINVKIAVLVIPLAFCFYSSITGLRGSIVTDYLQVAIILIIGLGLSVIFYYKYGDFGICSMVENFHDKGKFINITSYSLIMFFMAIISTGNSESVAVASIIANYIYRLNIKPQATDRQILKISRFTTGLFGIIAGILSFLIYSIGVQVYFLYLAMGIFLSAGVFPIILGIVWKRVSSFGAFWGTLLGFISGIIVWLVVASAQDGSSLLVAMGEMVPMACANCTVVLVSGIVCLIDGYWLQSGKFDFSRIQLMVTSFLKKQEIKDIKGLRPVSKSDYFENMNAYFKTNARKIISLAIYSSLAMEVFFPVIMYFSGFSFSKGFFGYWIIGTLVWLMFSTGYTILIPIIDFFQADEAEQLYYE